MWIKATCLSPRGIAEGRCFFFALTNESAAYKNQIKNQIAIIIIWATAALVQRSLVTSLAAHSRPTRRSRGLLFEKARLKTPALLDATNQIAKKKIDAEARTAANRTIKFK